MNRGTFNEQWIEVSEVPPLRSAERHSILTVQVNSGQACINPGLSKVLRRCLLFAMVLEIRGSGVLVRIV